MFLFSGTTSLSFSKMFVARVRLHVRCFFSLVFFIHGEYLFCISTIGRPAVPGSVKTVSEPSSTKDSPGGLLDGALIVQGKQETGSSRVKFDALIAALSSRTQTAGSEVMSLASELSALPQVPGGFAPEVLASWKPVQDFVSVYSPERAESLEVTLSLLLRYRGRAIELLGQRDSSRSYDDQAVKTCSAYAPVFETTMRCISYAFVSGSREHLGTVASLLIPLLQETLELSFRVLARAARWKRTLPSLRKLFHGLRHLEALNIACKAMRQLYSRSLGGRLPEAARLASYPADNH